MTTFHANQIFRIKPSTFNEIDDWIHAAEASGRNAQFGLDALAMLLARTNQAFAMEMSRGPVDPRAFNRAAAWKIPVRRITSRYYKGWKVRRMAPGVWMLFNDTREAWFIEFGIHPHSIRASESGTVFDARVRRPIRKLSLIRTLKFADESRVGGRIQEQIFAPFRPGMKYTKRGDFIINDQVQAVPGMIYL